MRKKEERGKIEIKPIYWWRGQNQRLIACRTKKCWKSFFENKFQSWHFLSIILFKSHKLCKLCKKHMRVSRFKSLKITFFENLAVKNFLNSPRCYEFMQRSSLKMCLHCQWFHHHHTHSHFVLKEKILFKLLTQDSSEREFKRQNL